VRHPQHDGFLLVMIGFLLQWPTIPTLVMFPILVLVYARLARAEEREVAAHFGQAWRDYAARTPGFVPRLGHRSRPHAPTRRAHTSPRAR
jgi:protein-S-isoprenylcysteine O-methyltransferase Ste14